MASYDIESWLADLETFLKANLNTQIAALNTEKNDSLTLATIDTTGGYFFQTMNDRVANFDPILFYGVDKIEAGPIGPATVEKYTIAVLIILADTGNDDVSGKRLLRYQRVLRDLFHSNFGQIGDNQYLKMNSLEPVAFTLANSGDAYHAVGVTLEVNIG